MTRWMMRSTDVSNSGGVANTIRSDSARKFGDYVRYARLRDYADKIIIIMAETPAAISRIEEIAAVPGIDVVNLGVNDIACAAGHPGEPEHAAVVALVDQAIAKILKSGKIVGLNVLKNWEERTPYFLGKGVR